MPAPTTAEATTSSQPTAGNGLERLYTTDLASEIEFLTARARSLGSGRANNMLAELDLKVRSYSVLSLACSGRTRRSANWRISSAWTPARSWRWWTSWRSAEP